MKTITRTKMKTITTDRRGRAKKIKLIGENLAVILGNYAKTLNGIGSHTTTEATFTARNPSYYHLAVNLSRLH